MVRASFIGVGLLLGVVGCEKVSDGPIRPDLTQRPANVVTTTGMIADVVKNVGGAYVQIDCLMGPGVDPHKYLPTAGDMTRLQNADIIFYNGLHLEGKMADVFEEMAHRVMSVAVTDRIDKSVLRKGEGDVEYDPHVWFDVQLWMKTVDRVRDALTELDPAHQVAFRANAEKYLQELEKLDRSIRQQVETLPKSRRVLITAHDAFGYFGRAYGFEVHGLQGVSTATDTSTKDVQRLADVIVQGRIPTIFGESSVPDRGIKAVQEAVSKKLKDEVREVRLSQKQLFSDALGEPDTPEGTYIGMVKHNVDAIVSELK